jgi:hypothetical protein
MRIGENSEPDFYKFTVLLRFRIKLRCQLLEKCGQMTAFEEFPRSATSEAQQHPKSWIKLSSQSLPIVFFAESGRKLCVLTSIPAFRQVHEKGRVPAAYLHLTKL